MILKTSDLKILQDLDVNTTGVEQVAGGNVILLEWSLSRQYEQRTTLRYTIKCS